MELASIVGEVEESQVDLLVCKCSSGLVVKGEKFC